MKTNTTRDDLVMRALCLAHMVNQYTEYCVFIHYSGHVQSMDIIIAPTKKRFCERALETEFYTTYKEYAKESDAEIKAKIEILKHILQENEIPFDDCKYTETLIREYTF